jgi:hypothetical protein
MPGNIVAGSTTLDEIRRSLSGGLETGDVGAEQLANSPRVCPMPSPGGDAGGLPAAAVVGENSSRKRLRASVSDMAG